MVPPTETLPAPNLFEDYLATLPKWESTLFYSLVFHEPVEAVAQGLQSGAVLLASDGAVKIIASFGWVLASTSGQRLVTCSGPVYGSNPASFRV